MMITPVMADLTGYTQASYNQWQIAGSTGWKGRYVEDGVRYWTHVTIKNVGSDVLTEAKARIWIWGFDTDGDWIPDITGPTTIDSMLDILNAEKIGPKTYLIDLGTIQPEHTKKMLLNVWCSEPVGFVFYMSVWYLA
jgi:hypothetical protein